MFNNTSLSRKNLKKALIVVTAIVLYCTIWVVFDIEHLLSVETLTHHRTTLTAFIQKNYFFAVSVYIICFTVHSICALPATSLLFIAAGMLFNFLPGVLYAWIGSMIGGSCLFALTRSHLGTSLHRRYAHKLDPLKTRIRQHAFTALMIARAIPVMPFFLTNIAAGLAMVSTATFITSLALGTLPSIMLYVFIGSELTHLPFLLSLLQNPLFILCCGLLGMSVLYGIYRRSRI